MKRLFAAIIVHPSEEFLAKYFYFKKLLVDEKIRWVDPGNIHVTLKFLGETPEHHIPAIDQALRQASKGISPFTFHISKAGIFGSRYNPRVIWFGIHPYDDIVRLANNVFNELERIGIERDRQNFVPHLTIARMKHLKNRKYFQQVIDSGSEGHIQNEEVNEFHLFESRLGPEGPEYTIISSYSFEN